MDELLRKRHQMEQSAYSVLREALVEAFLRDPVAFVTQFGKRPEDLTGADLRAVYPDCLIHGIEPGPRHKTDPGFVRRFTSGELFGCISAAG